MEWLLEQNETCWIVVPYTRGHLPRSFHPWFEQVDRVIELQLPKRKTASAIRNRNDPTPPLKRAERSPEQLVAFCRFDLRQ